MDINQTITLLASIGACLTAISSFFVLKQNKKQREDSYKPQLVIKKINFESVEIEPDNAFQSRWISNDFMSNDYRFALPIVNIGLGSAKQIKAIWSFDFETYISQINMEAQKSFASSYVEYKNETLAFISKSGTPSIHNLKLQKEQEIDYIIPIANSNELSKLFFPMAIIHAYNTYLYFFSKKVKREDFPKFPKIKVEISYFDIGNKKYKEHFEVIPNFICLQKKDDTHISFKGFIETKSIK